MRFSQSPPVFNSYCGLSESEKNAKKKIKEKKSFGDSHHGVKQSGIGSACRTIVVSW